MTKSSTKPLRNKTKRYNILSLFTGAGALDHGFERTGRFETRLAVEKEPIFCRTLHANQARGALPSAAILNASIDELAPKSILSRYFGEHTLDGIIGGPPCESFSSMGKQRALGDPRGHLIFSFCKWVRRLKPSFFLFENVPHLAHRFSGEILAQLVQSFTSAGYKVSKQILKASDYGAATKRKRLLIVGVRRGPYFVFPKPSHAVAASGFQLKRQRTVRDALKGLPEPFDSEGCEPTWHKRIAHNAAVVKRFSLLSPGEQDKVRKRWRLSLSEPSPSLVAGNLDGIRSHIHPTQPRELTNRESARIHGFDDDFVFCGNHAAVGKQIANSVPIELASALAHAIAEHLDKGSA
jgi:DNA (cytosine-5)-methyltransferase 1